MLQEMFQLNFLLICIFVISKPTNIVSYFTIVKIILYLFYYNNIFSRLRFFYFSSFRIVTFTVVMMICCYSCFFFLLFLHVCFLLVSARTLCFIPSLLISAFSKKARCTCSIQPVFRVILMVKNSLS